ncbi:Transposase IS66 family protein [uncultured archaeon]|nr:Transposase IS66 family protein [uncultured archaeon]
MFQVKSTCQDCLIQQSYQELLKRIDDLERINKEQAAKISELESEIKKYKNPHTPSSVQRFKKNPPEQITCKKRGAPKGHKGATRQTPEPDEIIDIKADFCERCNSYDLEIENVESTTIEDIPPPPKIKVTQYNVHSYKCRKCGHRFTAKNNKYTFPEEGRFGINLFVYVPMLKFSLRGVIRRIGDFAAQTISFIISPKGLLDMLYRVAEACKAEYLRILGRIRTVEFVYVDETGMRVEAANQWLWIFRSTDEILVAIRPSRGSNVLKEILGENTNIATVNDGWSAYNIIALLQRCWAHLLREVDEFIEKPGGRELSGIVHRKFNRLKLFLDKDQPMEERILKKKILDREMENLVLKFANFKDLKKPVTYIENGLGSWYTCLLFPGMEPTNNLGEQAMREHVLMRKIIGMFRSQKGAENYQYIASMFATWRLQGMDIFQELGTLLKKEVCGG